MLKDTELKEMLGVVQGLRHAHLISNEDATRWLRTLSRWTPSKDRMVWSILRTERFGGSSAGDLVAAYQNRNPYRKTAYQIIATQLMKIDPERPTGAMNRGNRLEDAVIRPMFEEMLSQRGYTWTRREDLEKKLFQNKHPNYPWLAASLDGLYEINGKLHLIDFKAPGTDVLEDYRRKRDFDEYVYQLHHYHLSAEGQGVEIDAMSLVMYDYANDALEVFDVAYEPQKTAEIVEALSFWYDEYLMKGLVPEKKEPVLVQADGGIPDDVQAAAERWAQLKIIEAWAADQLKQDRSIVESWIGEVGSLGNGKLEIQHMEVTAKQVLDKDKAVARLEDIGVTKKRLDACRLPDKYDPKKLNNAFDAIVKVARELVEAAETGAADVNILIGSLKSAVSSAPVKDAGDYDEEKLEELLDSLGEDPYNYIIEKLTAALPRGKKPEFLAYRELVEAKAGEVISDLFGTHEPEIEQNPVAKPAA